MESPLRLMRNPSLPLPSPMVSKQSIAEQVSNNALRTGQSAPQLGSQSKGGNTPQTPQPVNRRTPRSGITRRYGRAAAATPAKEEAAGTTPFLRQMTNVTKAHLVTQVLGPRMSHATNPCFKM
eukprot:6198118-Pleurochrysis_carterae.AAC.4